MSGISHHDCPSLYLFQHYCPQSDQGLLVYHRLFLHRYIGCQPAILPHVRTTAQNCPCYDKCTLFYLAVVCNMDKIVYLGIILNHSVPQRATVNARVCSNINIISYYHPTYVRKMYRLSISFVLKPKSRLPNNRTRLNLTMLSYFHLVVQNHIGMQNCAISYFTLP